MSKPHQAPLDRAARLMALLEEFNRKVDALIAELASR